MKALIEDNLIFTSKKIGDPIINAMTKAQAKEWFGVAPPDLSLIVRVRGVDWLYTYLNSFYRDDKRLWGTNNARFPDVAMPNVLAHLQGQRIPIYKTKVVPYGDKTKEIMVIDYLEKVSDGKLSDQAFNLAVNDIVNFLNYVAEPVKQARYRLGIWTLLFLFIFMILTYLLKKEFWKDLKGTSKR